MESPTINPLLHIASTIEYSLHLSPEDPNAAKETAYIVLVPSCLKKKTLSAKQSYISNKTADIFKSLQSELMYKLKRCISIIKYWLISH